MASTGKTERGCYYSCISVNSKVPHTSSYEQSYSHGARFMAGVDGGDYLQAAAL